MEDVYNFNTIRFVNCVSYLKAKSLYEIEINKQWRAKHTKGNE